MTKEQLAKKIMLECEKEGEPVTKDEALEMAEMELKSNANCKQYVTNSTKSKSAPKPKKIDQDKLQMIKFLSEQLIESNLVQKVNVYNDQREITFTLNGFNYSLVLTKHKNK